ncbi:MAG TPA: ATP-dependent zinc protease [Gammaproteobacteria bacterium]
MKPMILHALFLACVLLATAGCAMTDKAAMRELIEGEREQTRLLAERNSLLEEQTSLIAQSIESHKRMVEMLADVDRTLREIRNDARERQPDAGNDSDAEPQTRTVDVASPAEKTVLGRNEWAWVELLGRNLKARVDTGALSASLNAVELQPFERDGQDWIRFRVPDEEHPDGGETYETPLLHHVLIRQASADELERRPVVKLRVRVGDLIDDIEFSLTNRENMTYPMLLGRDFLRDVAVVDVARKFTQEKYQPPAPASPPTENVTPQ